MPTRMDWIASIRKLRRKPLYALTVSMALGLGVGAATIVFSWFEGLFLRPLPGVRDSRSLQVFELQRPEYKTSAFSYPVYRELSEALAGSMDVVAYSMMRLTLSGSGKPERHWALFVSSNFFSVLEVRPWMGRLDAGNAVLGYDLWRTRFQADPSIIGRTIYLNRQPVKIGGVAPREFRGPYTWLSLGLYLPAARDTLEGGSSRLGNRRAEWLTLLARLKPGVPHARASEQARLVARGLDQAYPAATFHKAQLLLKPFWQSSVGAQAVMGPILVALAGVALIVLLLASSNAAGMMILENALRGKDMAIRSALGAGSSGLLRYCVAEALLLSALAAGIGLAITKVAADHLQNLVPDIQFPVKVEFSVDGFVLGFSLLAATMAAVFCGGWNGVAAGWQSTSLALRGEMSTSSASRGGSRLRGMFIAVQIALTFVLLSSAALFYRGVERARDIDVGFDARSVSVVRMDLSGSRYTPAEGAALLQMLRSRLSEVRGIGSVSMATSVPLGFDDHNLVKVLLEGQAVERQVRSNRVSPDYFASMGIPLLAGRDFNDLDRAGSVRVAIVNEALARKLWNVRSPLGSAFVAGGERYQVVGVVRNTKVWSLTQESQPYLYLPLWQSYSPEVAIHVKSSQRPASIYRLVENKLAERDASLPVVSRQTMSQQVDAAVFPQHIALVMLSVFSLLGIYMAAVGLYGVIAHAARSRTREIAIRMAVGATSGEICRIVTRQTVRLVGVGLCVGAALAAALSHLLGAVLFGAGGIDLLSLLAPAAMIAVVAILATSMPTLRAMRVQPATALRTE